ARLVAADLDHVDRVVGAVERGAAIGRRPDLGRRSERVGDPTGYQLRRLEALGVDVEERDLRLGELLEAEDVAEQVAGEDRAARADERNLRHARRLCLAAAVPLDEE